MLGMSPAMNAALAFKDTNPRVRLTDLRTDATDQTTYTFTACQIDLGGTASASDDAYGPTAAQQALTRASSKKVIVVAVHGEDAAATFSVTGVTLGGVAGTELYDRGGAGAGVLVNSALYWWPTDALGAITTTDIAVTFSEAVTSCAIGVISVENIMLWSYLVSGADTTGTGSLAVTVSALGSSAGVKGVYFAVSTINASNEAAQFDFGTTNTSNQTPVTLLYERNNGEMGYAAAWTYAPASLAGNLPSLDWTCSWSGAASADLIAFIGTKA